MQSRPTKFTIKVKREHNNDITASSSTTSLLPPPVLGSHSEKDQTEQISIPSPQNPETLISSSSSEEEEDNNCGTQNENSNNNNQIVVYSPPRDNDGDNDGVVDANPIGYRAPRLTDGKVLPSVGAFTVQCANCFKWRLIPTKEKYEEIREHILEQPFVCEAAREWRPEIKCEDEADIKQDGSRLWAIDKPNIAQPPPGWQRLLRIRSKESSKFADVYYVAPSGKRLRSMVEIQRYLAEHPEYSEGVSMSQFSFQIPRPLQKNYVKQRKSQTDAASTANDASIDNNNNYLQLPEPHLVPANVAPLSAVVPPWNPGLQLGGPVGYHHGGLYEPMGTPPPAKKVRRSPPNAIHID